MKQDDDLNLEVRPSDYSSLMPIQVGQHTPASSTLPQCHPYWTVQTMENPPSDGTPCPSFPGSSGQGYGFKKERPDGVTSDSPRSPQQNAFQFPQGTNPTPAFLSGPPPLAFANGAPVQRFPNSLASSMFPGGMPGLAVGNDAFVWRMLMDTCSRMANHQNELVKNHMSHLQMQNSVEYSMQFAPMDQRAMTHCTPSELHENLQQSQQSFSSMESFSRQTMGLGYSSLRPDLSTAKKKSTRSRKTGKKSSPISQPDDPQNLLRNLSSEPSVTHPLAFPSPYPHFPSQNSLSAPNSASTLISDACSIDIKSEPGLDDAPKTSSLPQPNKESFTQLKLSSPGLRSHELPVASDPQDLIRMVTSCSTANPTESGSDHERRKSTDVMRESLSRSSSARKTPPEIELKQDLASEEHLYATGKSLFQIVIVCCERSLKWSYIKYLPSTPLAFSFFSSSLPLPCTAISLFLAIIRCFVRFIGWYRLAVDDYYRVTPCLSQV